MCLRLRAGMADRRGNGAVEVDPALEIAESDFAVLDLEPADQRRLMPLLRFDRLDCRCHSGTLLKAPVRLVLLVSLQLQFGPEQSEMWQHEVAPQERPEPD